MSRTTTKPSLQMLTDSPITKWVVVAFLVVVAFVALFFARRVIEPVDRLVTQQACSTYGKDVLSRELVEHETSNRFSLVDRRLGSCVYGPVVEFDEDGEVIEPETDAANGATTADAADEDTDEVPEERFEVAIPDVETNGFYRAMKWVFVLLQLGAASAAVRVVGEPLLDRFGGRKPASK